MARARTRVPPPGGESPVGCVLAEATEQTRRSRVRPGGAASETTSASGQRQCRSRRPPAPATLRERGAIGSLGAAESLRPKSAVGQDLRAPRPGCAGCHRPGAPADRRNTRIPSGSAPKRSAKTCRRVKQSSSGWGWVLVPAVAGVDHRARSAPAGHLIAGQPDEGWRTIRASMPMASIVSTVSRSDSPFLILTEELETPGHDTIGRQGAWPPSQRTGGPGRFLEETRWATARPRRVGTFGMAPALHFGEGLGHPEHLGDPLAAEVGPPRGGVARSRRGARPPAERPPVPRSSVDQGADGHPVLAHVDHLLTPGREASCPHSRAGSAARGAPGRP